MNMNAHANAQELFDLTGELEIAIANKDWPLAIQINKKMQPLFAFREGFTSVSTGTADQEAWDAERKMDGFKMYQGGRP